MSAATLFMLRRLDFHCPTVSIEHMRVDLSRPHVLMTQQFLDRPNILPFPEASSRKNDVIVQAPVFFLRPEAPMNLTVYVELFGTKSS